MSEEKCTGGSGERPSRTMTLSLRYRGHGDLGRKCFVARITGSDDAHEFQREFPAPVACLPLKASQRLSITMV